jgi:hypothetical protein
MSDIQINQNVTNSDKSKNHKNILLVGMIVFALVIVVAYIMTYKSTKPSVTTGQPTKISAVGGQIANAPTVVVTKDSSGNYVINQNTVSLELNATLPHVNFTNSSDMKIGVFVPVLGKATANAPETEEDTVQMVLDPGQTKSFNMTSVISREGQHDFLGTIYPAHFKGQILVRQVNH